MSESERFAHMFDKSIGLIRKWPEIRVGLMAAQVHCHLLTRIILPFGVISNKTPLYSIKVLPFDNFPKYSIAD